MAAVESAVSAAGPATRRVASLVPVATAAQPAPDAIRIRARLKDGDTHVMVLMPHPMETGLRAAEAPGTAPPAHFITQVQVAHEGRPVLQARLSIAVSKDPLLSFRFRGGSPGGRITVAWADNLGQSRSAQALIE